MNQQNHLTFSRRNTIFLGICLGGFTLLLLIGVIPLKAQHRALDQEIATLKGKLADQQQNQTNIALIDGLLAKIDQEPTPQLVALTPLPQNETSHIFEDVKTIAKAASLDLTTIEPLLNNKDNWQSLTVQTELRGLFPDLRAFLLKLLALPYVRQIDRIEIHPDSTELKISLTYTIALS